MLDLNDFRVFEAVARLQSFSEASFELGQPKSSVSRSVGRLEKQLSVRLLQRTTRQVVLTPAGELMLRRCGEMLGEVKQTVDLVDAMSGSPRGMLRITSGIELGVNVLGEILPGFLARYPDVDVDLDLRTEVIDIIPNKIDVAIRIGQLPDSSQTRVMLGNMTQYLCASPDYLKRNGEPESIEDIAAHRAVDMPTPDGRASSWTFVRGNESIRVQLKMRVAVNDALTIHRLVRGGAGLGIIFDYACGPDLAAGRLVRVLPEWSPPPVPVSLVFPSRREISPAVRAFVDYIKEITSSDAYCESKGANIRSR